MVIAIFPFKIVYIFYQNKIVYKLVIQLKKPLSIRVDGNDYTGTNY